jgi:hypothetical protein
MATEFDKENEKLSESEDIMIGELWPHGDRFSVSDIQNTTQDTS